MTFNRYNLKPNQGQSLIELMIAMAIFVLAVSAISWLIIDAYLADRAGRERMLATFLAKEGMEATRSIRDNNWGNLVVGEHGLAISGGNWIFSGTQDDVSNQLKDGVRKIIVENIDSHRKRITSRIDWQFTPLRQNSVTLVSYLTNWQKLKAGGMLVYADFSGANDVIRYQLLDENYNWGSVQTVPNFGVPLHRDTRRIKLYSSPTRNEKILVTKHVATGLGDDQYLYVQVWNGISWGNIIQLASWPGITRPAVRNFDGDYLANGNFLLVYENNTNTPQYRIWDGENWSSVQPTLNVGGNPEWIVVRARPNTNEAMVAVFDAGNDTNTMYWNGSFWTNLTEHATSSGGPEREIIGFEWSITSPTVGALIFNEANDNNPNIRIWNGTAWSSSVENVNIGGAVRAMQISSRPTANEFLACFKDSLNDINCLKTDFAPFWQTLTNGELTTNTDSGAQRSFSLAYEIESGDPGLVVYSSGASAAARAIPKYRTFNPTTNLFSSESSLADLGGTVAALETVKLIHDPYSNDIMVLMGTTNQNLWTAVWNGTDNNFYATGDRRQMAQGLHGSFDEDFWFDFEWNK